MAINNPHAKDTVAIYRIRVALSLIIFDGVAPDWFEAVLAHSCGGNTPATDPFHWNRLRGLGFKLADACEYLTPTLGFEPNISVSWDKRWIDRACVSRRCSVRMICPLHITQSQTLAEIATNIFNTAVAKMCLGSSQFVGRNGCAVGYCDLPMVEQSPHSHTIIRYLHFLGFRGFIFGYDWANSDGIHGWLTAEETKQMYALLEPLDLPRFPPTFEAMRAFKTGFSYQPPQPYTWKHLSLAFVRTVALLAVERNWGILWGNDVSL